MKQQIPSYFCLSAWNQIHVSFLVDMKFLQYDCKHREKVENGIDFLYTNISNIDYLFI